MILLIDNYDSFTFNLYQYLGALNPDIRVVKNDELTVDEIKKLNPTHIVLSPGPGRPIDAGVIEDVCKSIHDIPILGVCLGHQAICEAYGLEIENASRICHGKRDMIDVDNNSVLFKGLDKKIPAARYHSLIGVGETDELRVTSRNSDGEIMAVEHKKYPIYGIQFHPESILTLDGMTILDNFLREGARRWKRNYRN